MASAKRSTAAGKGKPAAKSAGKTSKPKVTLEQVQAVAEDFNGFMWEAGEGINLELDLKAMTKEITEAAADLEESDTITQATADTLTALGVEFAATVSEDEPEEAEESDEPEESTDEEEESEDGPEEEEEAEDMGPYIKKVKSSKKMEEIKAIAKDRGIRIPPPFLKDIKKLRDYVVDKLENPAPKTKEGKKSSAGGGSLSSFFEKHVKKGFDMKDEDEIVALAKKSFPDKPYRVIGNSLYAFVKKIG